MACIRVDGHEGPLVFPLNERGRAKVLSHLLHVCFKFVESSIYIEEEKKSKLDELQQSIPMVKFVDDEGYYWYLGLGNYKAFRLPLSMLASSTEVESRILANSTVDMPYIVEAVIPNLSQKHFPILPRNTVVSKVKVEKFETIVELSSKLERKSTNLTFRKTPCGIRSVSKEKAIVHSESNTPSNSLAPSILLGPLMSPSFLDQQNIMQCSRRFSTVHHSQNELSTINMDAMKHHRV